MVEASRQGTAAGVIKDDRGYREMEDRDNVEGVGSTRWRYGWNNDGKERRR